MFKVLNLLSLTALLKNLSVNSLLFRVLWLKIPWPFALVVWNAPLTHEDRAASWLRWSRWYPTAGANLDKLHHTSPHPLSSCRCFNRGQITTRKPTFAKNRSLLLEQQSKSQNVLTRTCLRSSGILPEFKHCTINVNKLFNVTPSITTYACFMLTDCQAYL